MNASNTTTDPNSQLEATFVSVPKCERCSESEGKEFDVYAAQYEAAINQGLNVSGEGPEYFAQRRIEWTSKILPDLEQIFAALDFGCGVGIATPLLQQFVQPNELWGFDPSTAAIDRAKTDFANSSTHFTASAHDIPDNHFDLAYCNGVFHHITPADREFAFEMVYRSLKPGGWFAFWENNPWNPGTRYVMSKIPFDRGAIVIFPREAKSLLRAAGFEIARRDCWFIFPRCLSWLRPLESLVYQLPIGAQYLVLAKKPNPSL